MIRLSVIGHLGHDALKKVINGKSVLSFSVAQNEQYKNLKGVTQERTTWINCSVWGRDNLAPYLRKGTLVYVEGRPAFKGYAGKQGEVLAGVNMTVMELALLPGARGVLGTGSAGVVEGNEEEGNEEDGSEEDGGEEYGSEEGLLDEDDDGAVVGDEVSDVLAGNSGVSNEESGSGKGKSRGRKRVKEDGVSSEEAGERGEDDGGKAVDGGVRNDLPF